MISRTRCTLPRPRPSRNRGDRGDGVLAEHLRRVRSPRYSAVARERPRIAGVAARIPARAEDRARDARERRSPVRADAHRCAAVAKPRAPEHSIKVTGNLKFDVELPRDLLEAAARCAGSGARERPVWIAASTTPVRSAGCSRRTSCSRGDPGLLLVLVPRHPERFKSVARLCRRRGLPSRCGAGRRARCRQAPTCWSATRWGSCSGSTRLQTSRSSAAASCRMADKTSSKLRRQRAVGLRAAHVPLRRDRRDGARARRRAPSARRAGLAAAVALYLEQPELRRAAGRAAHTLVTDNRGALARTLELISGSVVRVLPRGGP